MVKPRHRGGRGRECPPGCALVPRVPKEVLTAEGRFGTALVYDWLWHVPGVFVACLWHVRGMLHHAHTVPTLLTHRDVLPTHCWA